MRVRGAAKDAAFAETLAGPFAAELPRALGFVALGLFALGGLIHRAPEKARDLFLYFALLFLVPPWIFFGLPRFKKPLFSYVIILLAAFMGSYLAKLGAVVFCGMQLFFEIESPFKITAWKRVGVVRALQLWAIWVINGELIFSSWDRFGGRAFESVYTFAAVVFAIFCWSRVGRQIAKPGGQSSRLRQFWVLPPLIMAIPILWALPESWKFAHHWDFYVGPVMLLREGGRLLHDVPSQYGLLNIWLLRALSPIGPYRGFFLTLVGLYALAALLLAAFLAFCFGKGRTASFMAGAVSVAVVLLNPTWLVDTPGIALSLPSMGPFRFLWVLVLLATVLWRPRQIYWIGTASWVLACIWSVESAVYASATWLPAYWLMLRNERRWTFLRAFVPFLALAAVGLTVGIEYRVSIGAWPDLWSYVEYAFAYVGGFGTIGADRNGPVWAVVLPEVFLLLIAVRLDREKKRELLPVCLSAIMALGSVSSYYASRSHPGSLVSLLPVYAAAWGVAIYVVRCIWPRELTRVWRFALPFLVVSTMVAVGDVRFPKIFWQKLQSLTGARSDEVLVAARECEPLVAASLLVDAGIREGDPLVSLEQWLPTVGSTIARPWLPIASWSEYVILPEARRRVYLKRWAERGLVGSGGYLLYTSQSLAQTPELGEFLRSFKRVSRVQKEGWILDRYLF